MKKKMSQKERMRLLFRVYRDYTLPIRCRVQIQDRKGIKRIK